MVATYEWDETKREKVLEKHGLDFQEVIEIFEGEHMIVPARSSIEPRFAAIGEWNGVLILTPVFFAMRGNARRIITALRARQNERRHYHAHHDRRRAQAQGPQ